MIRVACTRAWCLYFCDETSQISSTILLSLHVVRITAVKCLIFNHCKYEVQLALFPQLPITCGTPVDRTCSRSSHWRSRRSSWRLVSRPMTSRRCQRDPAKQARSRTRWSSTRSTTSGQSSHVSHLQRAPSLGNQTVKIPALVLHMHTSSLDERMLFCLCQSTVWLIMYAVFFLYDWQGTTQAHLVQNTVAVFGQATPCWRVVALQQGAH